VGRAIVRRLLAAGRSVRVISRSGGLPPQPGVANCRGDVTSGADLAEALRGCDAVIHCAGERHDTGIMQAVNVRATGLLLDIARDARLRFFCYISSAGVIGRTRARIVDETTACHPMNAYERTKLAAELIVRRGLPGASVVILRPTNVFDAQTLATWWQDTVRSRFRRFLKGRENTHLIYVEDVAATVVHWLAVCASQTVDTFMVSSDDEGGSSYRELQVALASMTHNASARPGPSAPLWMPQLARLIRHGNSNRGDVIYSSRRLREAGMRFPYGWRKGLVDAVSQWRGV
jgi:nucleoside-diphosphate-sugar epimerase